MCFGDFIKFLQELSVPPFCYKTVAKLPGQPFLSRLLLFKIHPF